VPKIKLKSIAQLRKTRFKSTTSPLKASWQVAATPEYRYAQQGMFSFPSASTLGCEGGQREEKCLSVAKKWLALLLDFSGQLSVCCERSRPALETGSCSATSTKLCGDFFENFFNFFSSNLPPPSLPPSLPPTLHGFLTPPPPRSPHRRALRSSPQPARAVHRLPLLGPLPPHRQTPLVVVFILLVGLRDQARQAAAAVQEGAHPRRRQRRRYAPALRRTLPAVSFRSFLPSSPPHILLPGKKILFIPSERKRKRDLTPSKTRSGPRRPESSVRVA